MSVVEELKVYAQGQKLLVVEDDPDIQNLLVKTFKNIFTTVKKADNGLEALSMYKNERFDIVMSDISMPLMNGIEFSKAMRKINPTQHIIIISAHSDSEHLIDLIDIGVDTFILKPIKFDKLLYKLSSILENNFFKKEAEYIATNSVLNSLLETEKPNEVVSEKKAKKNMFETRREKIAEIKSSDKLNNINNNNITNINNNVVSDDISKLQVETEYQDRGAVLSAKSFIAMLQEDDIVWLKIKQDIYELVTLTNELDDNVNYLLLHGVSQDVVEDITRIFLQYYNIIAEIPKCDSISKLFFDIYEELRDLEYDNLTEKQKKGLELLEFLFEDIKNYIYNVFIEKSAEDINIFFNLIKSNIEQIKIELQEQKANSNNTLFF